MVAYRKDMIVAMTLMIHTLQPDTLSNPQPYLRRPFGQMLTMITCDRSMPDSCTQHTGMPLP